MANVKKDNNTVPCVSGLLNTDGATVTPIKADPTNHAILISDDTTGSDSGGTRAIHDANDEKTWMAASSSDGTPVVLYVNSDGEILIKST